MPGPQRSTISPDPTGASNTRTTGTPPNGLTARRIFLLSALALAGAGANDDCEPRWERGFAPPGTNDIVTGGINALAVIDNGVGKGQDLYAGGEFSTLGGSPAYSVARWDPETMSWSPLGTGLSNGVSSIAVMDDGKGSGPALFVGGRFRYASGKLVESIARWDPQTFTWSPLGDGMQGDGVTNVYALTVFDDGLGAGAALYAGGAFATAGGVPANRIAKWSPAISVWSPLADGMNGRVHARTVFDDGTGAGPALYAGGDFNTAGAGPANGVAKWHPDTETWSPLGGGVSGRVLALAGFDDGEGPALYAGGDFTTADGVVVNNIAKWNPSTSTWSPMDGGMTGGSPHPIHVGALHVFDDGSGDGPALFAGGRFDQSGGSSSFGFAKWNHGQSTWSSLGEGVSNRRIADFVAHDDGSGAGPALFAAGWYFTAGGVSADGIAKWRPELPAWEPLGAGVKDTVRAFAVQQADSGEPPHLYIGGDFTTSQGASPTHIAQWAPEISSWSNLGEGVNDAVEAIAVLDDGAGAGPQVYATGAFTEAGGTPVNYIARWDPTTANWSALGEGLGGATLPRGYSLAAFEGGSGLAPALFVGGHFVTAGGGAAGRIAKWDPLTFTWSRLDQGVNDRVHALAIFDDGAGPALYAGGDFTTAGGAPANHIARWSLAAEEWLPLGAGMNDTVHDFGVFDDGAGDGPSLFAGGAFTLAGGVPANRVAKWNHVAQTWSSLDVVMNGDVHDLEVFDDGTGGGPALYVAGEFTWANGSANRIARWDPATGTWSRLESGMTDTVLALAVFNESPESGAGDALYAGGDFTVVDLIQSSRIAKWQACPLEPFTFGDLNGDGAVNETDLAILLGSWGDCPAPPLKCPADLSGDERVDGLDLAHLLSAWTPLP